MSQPEFPVEFLDSFCPLVREAKKWRLVYLGGTLETTPEDREFAECSTGYIYGHIRCENCDLNVPNLTKFNQVVQKVNDYYRQAEEDEKASLNLGAGI